MPRVLNKHRDKVCPGDIYVGRPTKWGNPFRMDDRTPRAQVITLYRDFLMHQEDLLQALPELRGHNLVCFCAPKPCHADVLLELANKEDY